jgi:peptidoglycan/xylan/chitin deacetylase (PgdA/CDA1 family)
MQNLTLNPGERHLNWLCRGVCEQKNKKVTDGIGYLVSFIVRSFNSGKHDPHVRDRRDGHQKCKKVFGGIGFIVSLAARNFGFFYIGVLFMFISGKSVFGSNIDLSTPFSDSRFRGKDCIYDKQGALIRMDTTSKVVYLIFSADEFGEGAGKILDVLHAKGAKGSFFLTGNFLRNTAFSYIVHRIQSEGHYLGPHSDRHLLYNTWENVDSLLVTRSQFRKDLKNNLKEIKKGGGKSDKTAFFLPPYEWCNKKICQWSTEMKKVIINLTPGTATNADYTTPDMSNYRSSEILIDRLFQFETSNPHGLNGAIILVHLGTHPDRKDKLYDRLDSIIDQLQGKGYAFERFK